MITVNDVQEGVVDLQWETDFHLFGAVILRYEKTSPLNTDPAKILKKGSRVDISFGEPGNIQKVKGYHVWRLRKDNVIEAIAHEFYGQWLERTQRLLPGPRATAIKRLISLMGEKPGSIKAPGGDIEYMQAESNVAMLYRLAGVHSVWRSPEKESGCG